MNELIGNIVQPLQIVGNISKNTDINVSIIATGARGEKGEKGDIGEIPSSLPASMIVEDNERVFLSPEEKSSLLCHNESYIHTQILPSNIWVINHNLNRYPSVSVIDSAGSLVIGNIVYDNSNQITLSFTAEFSGKALLN